MRVALTPLDFLERARRYYASLEGVVDGARRITYGEFAARAHRLAHLLRDSYGVGSGDRVAYLCGNTLELLEAYYGVLLAGAVLTPLNIRLAPREAQFVLDDCGAALLVLHPDHAELGNRLTPKDLLVLDDAYEAGLSMQPDTAADPGEIDEDAVCEIFYTSGSTGKPKGAMLTHRNLATHATDSALTLGLTHGDVILHTIPLFHVNGWGTPHYVTMLGARHVMLPRFDAGEVLRLIDDERVTRLSLVPTTADALLDHADVERRDLSSLVQVTVGGAPPRPGMIATLEERLGCEVVCGYGLTEAAPQLTKAVNLRSHAQLPRERQVAKRSTTGLPNLGVDLRVLDDDDREVAWDGRAIGEICVRSNHVMEGYWNAPDATAAVLQRGWLRTGDLATVDDEGYVTIVDRRKDLIISGGENIASVEVEATLLEHPQVAEAAVVGMPDEQWGEVPRAFVVVRTELGSGADVRRRPTPDELIEWVRARLARFKAPKRVEIVDELPKGGTGKILKSELRSRPL